MAELRRLRSPAEGDRWVWVAQEVFRDLTAAGLEDGLDAVARWLADPAARERLIAEAPEVAASTWPRLLPGRPGKALCLGRNFAAHAREMGARPAEGGGDLLWFAKLPDVLVGPGEAVEIPAWLEGRVDPEAEVVALVGRPLRNAGEEEAAAAVCAYALGNDVTARGVQGADKEKGWPWLRGKNLATFGALGPGWTPAEEVPLDDRVVLRGRVNGVIRQEGSLGDLLWTPGRALAEISRWVPLWPGDALFLGTPSGVAPIHPGDELVVEAPRLGRLVNPVVAAGN